MHLAKSDAAAESMRPRSGDHGLKKAVAESDAAMEFLAARDVTLSYPASARGASPPVLSAFNLGIRRGEFFCLLGPSGCGKTSVLSLLAGFLKCSEGTIELEGKPIAGPDVERGVVFQSDDALFPWLRAIDNVAFGLRVRGISIAERYAVARKYLHLVHLDGQESKYPSEMSGGMKQRVQIARVLAIDPKILLMDEPFGAVDAQTRTRLQDELVEIWAKTRKTVLFVTHDIAEAVLLADRIGVMSSGPGAHLATIVSVDLPRPRRRSSQGFGEYWDHISGLIEGADSSAEGAA